MHMLVGIYALIVVTFGVGTLLGHGVDKAPALEGEMKFPEPILYPMYDAAGDVIVEEIDLSDLDSSATKAKKIAAITNDIVGWQYWTEAMNQVDLMNATATVGIVQPC